MWTDKPGLTNLLGSDSRACCPYFLKNQKIHSFWPLKKSFDTVELDILAGLVFKDEMQALWRSCIGEGNESFIIHKLNESVDVYRYLNRNKG